MPDVWDSAGKQAEYFEQRGLPRPAPGPLGQFLHGLLLPLHLARMLLADPAARTLYLRVCCAQALVVVALGPLFMQSGLKVADDIEVPAAEARAASDDAEKRARKEAVRRVVAEEIKQVARRAGLKTEVRLETNEPTPAAPPKAPDAPAPDEDPEEAAQEAAEAMRAAGAPEDVVRRVEAAVKKASVSAKQVEESVRRAEEAAGRPLKRQRWRDATFLDLEFWAALLAGMHIAQWIVIALSRDYHDAIGRELSLRSGLAPEDGPLVPHVRLNFPWLRSKMKRRWRALVLFAMGVPLLWLVTRPMPFEDHVLTALSSLWGGWWLMVFSAAKSARAWKDETARPPWFLRGWTWLTQHVPGFRWSLPLSYGRLWERQTASVYSPAAWVERHPFALAGLTAARVVGMVPGLKCFVRPLIPVAAAHLIEAYGPVQPALPVPSPLASTEPVAVPTPAAQPTTVP
ncbi:hypothetical protein P2318_23505 [Myxococcaceae bacterium GXIMD 01537]